MPLDPQVAQFLQRVAALNAPPVYTLTPDQARNAVPQIPPPYEPVATAETRRIDGPNGEIPIRIYTPLAAHRHAGQGPVPLLMFFHGGGWMVGDIRSYEHLCCILANRFEAVVISVDYRLSPEHRFPAGLEDCYAATVWAHDHAQSLHGDPHRILVAGDSAGGNLAVAVALLARDRSGPPLAHQILIYPVTDYDFETPSYLENAEGYLLTRTAMRWFWEMYLPPGARLDGTEDISPYAAPLRGNLAGLPPAHVMTAEFDPLRDEGELLARKLEQAGVPVVYQRYDGMIHGFVRRTDLYDAAQQSLQDMVQVYHDLKSKTQGG